jgi:hypothetical protein
VPDRPEPEQRGKTVVGPPLIKDFTVLTIPPGAEVAVAVRNIEEAFVEAVFRAGLGLGQFRRPRVVVNRDGSVDGRLTISDLPEGHDLYHLVNKLQRSLPAIPGAQILLDWRLGIAKDIDELQQLDEKYLATRSGKTPWHVPSSYYGAAKWQDAFIAAKRILGALRERGRKVISLMIDIYWDPKHRHRTVRKKQPKPGYKRTWAWRPRVDRKR